MWIKTLKMQDFIYLERSLCEKNILNWFIVKTLTSKLKD
jgi:hypothetical protein